MSTLSRMGARLYIWASDRHDLIATAFSYVMDSNKTWWFMGISGSVISVLVGVYLWPFLFAWFALGRKVGSTNWHITIILYEFWIWFLNIPLIGGDVITMIASHTHFDPTNLILLAVWIEMSYVLVDMTKPPRKRRKLELLPAAKPVFQEFIT